MSGKDDLLQRAVSKTPADKMNLPLRRMLMQETAMEKDKAETPVCVPYDDGWKSMLTLAVRGHINDIS